MSREQVESHLEFFEALGVAGFRREAEWRDRAAPSALPAGQTGSREAPAGDDVPAPADAAAAGAFERSLQDEPPAPMAGLAGAGASPAQPARLLATIRDDLGHDCRRCKLHRLGRRQVVFGVGNPRADLMFVGEAPGADEDIQGEPFVGRAGQLLTRIIEAIGLRRDEVYIANVIKCRPPQNRNPEPDEVEQCEPFLFRQVDAVQPKVIVALGKFAAQSLLRSTEPITRLRGREFQFREAILIPTYHPAFLLRNPEAKRDVWEDMKRVRALLRAER